MSARFVLVCLVLLGSSAYAQQFHHAYTLTLPDSIIKVQPARVDLNNDGLLDLLLISEVTSGRTWLQFVKGDTTLTPFLIWQATRTIGPLKSFAITDYDHDNRLDIVLSSTAGRVAVYVNKGDFAFAENPLNVPPFSQLLVSDLDDDAKPEWIISDRQATDPKLLVMRQAGAFSWLVANDSLKINAESLALTDQDDDGRHDVFVSGKASVDSVVSAILVNNGRLGLKPQTRFRFAGNSASGDVNADGIFDVAVMGEDHHGVVGTRLFKSEGGTHVAVDVPVVFNDAAPFLADLNSDGIVDYNYRGRKGTDTLNILQYAMNDFDSIPSDRYRAHVFGDEDSDGDLDLVVVTKNTRLQLLSYTNMTHENKPPASPRNPMAIPVFNRMLYYWDPVTDDHTPSRSLTYDLYVDGTQAFAAAFDLINEKRLSVTHGNNGTHNFKLMHNVTSKQFAVQAVDNSFHAGKPCVGSASWNCPTSTVTRVLFCKGETSTAQAPREVLWFSFLNGYLGKASVMPLLSASDTVFYYDPAAKGCDALKVWTIVVTDDVVRNTDEHYACSRQSLRFEVESGWTSVSWHSHYRGALGTGNSINYVANTDGPQPDTVTAVMKNAVGCTRRDKHVVKISVPDVHVVPEQVRIAKGGQIELVASGAMRYEWSPTEGLSAHDVPNPVAAPGVTTTYRVTGYDSLQCTATGQSIVFVENGGFVPNLFTPNGDGKNDEIKIYGLTEARNFVFTVLNREGSVVYRSDNLSETTQKGWDGTRQGMQQPAGVYVWKVTGALLSGEKLLLNGKESGSIVLVR